LKSFLVRVENTNGVTSLKCEISRDMSIFEIDIKSFVSCFFSLYPLSNLSPVICKSVFTTNNQHLLIPSHDPDPSYPAAALQPRGTELSAQSFPFPLPCNFPPPTECHSPSCQNPETLKTGNGYSPSPSCSLTYHSVASRSALLVSSSLTAYGITREWESFQRLLTNPTYIRMLKNFKSIDFKREE
jgi:hypothetical protein